MRVLKTVGAVAIWDVVFPPEGHVLLVDLLQSDIPEIRAVSPTQTIRFFAGGSFPNYSFSVVSTPILAIEVPSPSVRRVVQSKNKIAIYFSYFRYNI